MIINEHSESSLLLFVLDEGVVDHGEDSTGSDGARSHESVELLIVYDGELEVSWHDSASLVVLGGISCELENLSGEVFENGSHVDWGTGSNSGGSSRVSEVSGNSSNWELKSSLG